MDRRTRRALSLFGLAVIAASLHAQSPRVLVVKLLDGKTGQAVIPSNAQIRVNHQSTAEGKWFDPKDDGSVEVKVSSDAKVLSVRATYDNSDTYYVNCEVAKQKNTDEATWYPIDDILTSGIAAPNECGQPKAPNELQGGVKPGELILFVRKRNWKDKGLE
jgi:hypothetical protein